MSDWIEGGAGPDAAGAGQGLPGCGHVPVPDTHRPGRDAARAPDGLAECRSERQHRHDGWTAVRQAKFLNRLAETGVISDACAMVGMSTTSAYRMRQRSEGFARAWEQALDRATVELEAIAFERAVNGVEEDIIHYGKKVGTRRRYSDTLLKLLLQRRRPEAFGAAEGAGGSLRDANGRLPWQREVAAVLKDEPDLVLCDEQGAPILDVDTGEALSAQARSLQALQRLRAGQAEAHSQLEQYLIEAEAERAASGWVTVRVRIGDEGAVYDEAGDVFAVMTDDARARWDAGR
ncbi:hypothetical protein KCG44_14065 [Pacificimonas sp. WHA3]|uniref:Uncharacterized protein n=1 Tax=Pacificimonas pallii TaxID=2827236 RepID=A0ABS6SHM0_9SPHN|nr:hypothetical protein [Pacificimonas pallii]MBV7257907.1 hypothetical protein [Pacificimonas pallii]